MKCSHTGLLMHSCAHCSNTRLEHPEFTPRHRPDEEPRLFKGRDIVEWRGYGQTLGHAGSENARVAAADGSLRGQWQPRTDWARQNMIATLKGAIHGRQR